MGEVQKTDMQLKTFFEKTLGLVIQKADFSKGTLTLWMYRQKDNRRILFEQRPDTSMRITIGGVTRTIPAREQLEIALNHKPTDLEICRIVQEVILKMIDDLQDETTRQISRDFDRFGRRLH